MNLGNDDLMKIEPRDGERETISGVMAHAATLAAEEIVETIYPIRILDLIDDGNVALSQGGKRISESSLFNVYAPARRVTDKDTGRVTRVDGPWVALVKVTRVLPKFSLAKVVDGDYSAIQERAVCRRLDSARGSGIEITPSASINW